MDEQVTVTRQALPHVEAREPAVRSGGRGWLWVVLLLAGCMAAYYLVTRFLHHGATDPTAAAARTVPVVVATARTRDIPLYLDGLGTVTAFNTVSLRSRVDGELTEVRFTEGQTVKEGQVLAVIDPRPFQVQLEQAQGQLAKDQSTLKNAQLDLQRYKSIASSITQQQIDTQQAAVSQYEAAIQIDQGQIDNARLQLTYTQITSPISGRIGLRIVDRGNIVHANDPNGMAVITQVEPIAVVFTIAQDQVSQVFKRPDGGDKLPVSAFSRDMTSELAAGSLLAVDNQVDPTTGTVRLKGIFANTDHALFPNQFVNARLLVNTLRGAVVIPSAGVQRGPDSMFAYVVKPDNTVELHNIVPGPTDNNDTVIESGISPGEVVVIDGVDKLQPGAKVAPSRATTRPGAPGGGAASRPGRARASSQPSTRTGGQEGR